MYGSQRQPFTPHQEPFFECYKALIEQLIINFIPDVTVNNYHNQFQVAKEELPTILSIVRNCIHRQFLNVFGQSLDWTNEFITAAALSMDPFPFRIRDNGSTRSTRPLVHSQGGSYQIVVLDPIIDALPHTGHYSGETLDFYTRQSFHRKGMRTSIDSGRTNTYSLAAQYSKAAAFQVFGTDFITAGWIRFFMCLFETCGMLIFQSLRPLSEEEVSIRTRAKRQWMDESLMKASKSVNFPQLAPHLQLNISTSFMTSQVIYAFNDEVDEFLKSLRAEKKDISRSDFTEFANEEWKKYKPDVKLTKTQIRTRVFSIFDSEDPAHHHKVPPKDKRPIARRWSKRGAAVENLIAHILASETRPWRQNTWKEMVRLVNGGEYKIEGLTKMTTSIAEKHLNKYILKHNQVFMEDANRTLTFYTFRIDEYQDLIDEAQKYARTAELPYLQDLVLHWALTTGEKFNIPYNALYNLGEKHLLGPRPSYKTPDFIANVLKKLNGFIAECGTKCVGPYHIEFSKTTRMLKEELDVIHEVAAEYILHPDSKKYGRTIKWDAKIQKATFTEWQKRWPNGFVTNVKRSGHAVIDKVRTLWTEYDMMTIKAEVNEMLTDENMPTDKAGRRQFLVPVIIDRLRNSARQNLKQRQNDEYDKYVRNRVISGVTKTSTRVARARENRYVSDDDLGNEDDDSSDEDEDTDLDRNSGTEQVRQQCQVNEDTASEYSSGNNNITDDEEDDLDQKVVPRRQQTGLRKRKLSPDSMGGKSQRKRL